MDKGIEREIGERGKRGGERDVKWLDYLKEFYLRRQKDTGKDKGIERNIESE